MSRVSRKVEPSMNSKPVKIRSVSIAPALALALVLGGCASYNKDHFTVGSVPTDYRTQHPIVVSQSQVSEDMIVSSNMRGMSFRQENLVTDFLGRFRRSGASAIHIFLPAGSHNEAAAQRVGHDIINYMKEERVNRNQIKVSRYHASSHGDAATIRIAFDAVDASVASNCGQWTDDLRDTHENQNYENFGCATQNNLAEMIANPEDLINPRGQSVIDAERRDNVINDWRSNGTAALPSLL